MDYDYRPTKTGRGSLGIQETHSPTPEDGSEFWEGDYKHTFGRSTSTVALSATGTNETMHVGINPPSKMCGLIQVSFLEWRKAVGPDAHPTSFHMTEKICIGVNKIHRANTRKRADYK